MHWRTRNLPFLAGTVAGHGMSKDDALKLVTINNAKILGIDKYVGSLEVGKQATLVVSQGDLLDMRSAKVEHAFIQGKKSTWMTNKNVCTKSIQKNTEQNKRCIIC
jgi:imidazolonepropionase-like amidohydrolase